MLSNRGVVRAAVQVFVAAALVTPDVRSETAPPQAGEDTSRIPSEEDGANTLAVHLRELDDPDAAIRLRAAQALGELRSPDAVEALMRVVLSDPVPEVRGWCVHSLHQIGTPEAHAAISDAARDDRNERVRDLAASLCRDCAPTERPTSDTPSPFPTVPSPTPTAPAHRAPALDPASQAAVQHQATTQPEATQTPPPQDPQLRSRGIRALVPGIVLLVTSALPFAIGGVLVPRWEEVRVEGATTEWHRTAAYPGSIMLFILGSALVIPGLVLTPIGAVRLSRSRPDQQSRARSGSLSPFAAPTSNGGAIFGVSGYFF